MTRHSLRLELAAVIGAAAIALAACGGSSETSTSTSAATGSGQTQDAGGAMFTTAQLTAAAKLAGVSTAKLQAALQAIQPSRPSDGGSGSGQDGAQPGGAPPSGGGQMQRPDQSAMAAALAKKLDITSAKAGAALAKLMPSGGQGVPGRQAPSGSTPSG